MDILTGSNQVINPEYVSPLETKESPLSLLAKTCSNIGMDPPSRLTSSSKPGKEDSNTKSSSSPASSPGSATSRTSESRRRTPPASSQASSQSSQASQVSSQTTQAASRSKVSFKPYESVTSPTAASERGKSRSPTSKANSPRPAAAAIVTSSPSVSPSEKESPKPATSYLSPYGLGSPLDALYLRSGLPPSACRDPLCKGCLPGLCPSGCLHCKTLASLPGGPSPLGLGLYPPPGLVGGLQPYCCNWSEAGTYCGKRFNSSDELMQHLRGHTAADATVLPPPLNLMLPRVPYSAAATLSPLASLTPGRYHPYAKPGLAPSLAPGLAHGLTPSSLALYPYLANPYLYAGLRR